MRWHIDQIQGAIDRIKLTDSRKNHADYALSAIGFSKYCENQEVCLLYESSFVILNPYEQRKTILQSFTGIKCNIFCTRFNDEVDNVWYHIYSTEPAGW